MDTVISTMWTELGRHVELILWGPGLSGYSAIPLDQAAEQYGLALEIDPDFAEAHVYLASAHQSLYLPSREDDPEIRAHLDKAIEHYETAIDIAPGFAKARTNLGDALQAQGEAMRKNEYGQYLLHHDPYTYRGGIGMRPATRV